ncbi:MAG: WYL domain-containing protein [Bacteroidales bacterium]|nr:WYL domain-containing protein [Bacteroidales bacterium]
MPGNKNAIIRYQALDRCFRNPGRKYFINDLINACNEALKDVDPNSTGVKRRQIFEDIKFMEDSRGYQAPVERYRENRKVYYRYSDLSFSINNQPLNEQEAQQLKEALTTLGRFKGMPQFKWIEEIVTRLEQSFNLKTEKQIVSFDDNPYLQGLEHINELYNAIINRQVLSITYCPFKRDSSIEFIIHPYHLKQYNNRWFLFGLNDEYQQITNLALDRIKSIHHSDIIYQPNESIDFNEFFEDIIGVTAPTEGNLRKIKLKIEASLWPYIKTKPLHGSQKIIEQQDHFTIIQLEVIPNYEFEALVLSFGERIEVLEPDEVRNKLKDRINQLFKKYF